MKAFGSSLMVGLLNMQQFGAAFCGVRGGEGREVLLQIALHALLYGEGGGGGSKAVAHGLNLVGVVAELQQGTVHKAVAAVVELHRAVGKHDVVRTEQLVNEVDVGDVVVGWVVVDGAEVVPVAEIGEEFLYGEVVEDVPEEGVADDY